ncbi:MAG TPA: hypothetical protein PK252_11470 [Bacteroidales bacterium]|nr:hypothetical protein [Bacteroidales bacterium]
MKNKLLQIIAIALLFFTNVVAFAQSSPTPVQPANGPSDPGGGDPAIGTPLDSNAIFVLIFAGGLLLLLINRKKVLEFVKSQK